MNIFNIFRSPKATSSNRLTILLYLPILPGLIIIQYTKLRSVRAQNFSTERTKAKLLKCMI